MTKKQYGSVPGTSAVGPDDIFDDEDDGLADAQKFAQRQRQNSNNKPWGWDAFVKLPPEVNSGSMATQKWLKVMRILKFLSYAVVFIIVLGCGVIAKGAILFMTSQLRINKSVLYCNRLLYKDGTFVATLPEKERIAWIWCIIFAFTAPELGTLIRSVGIYLFKSSGKCKLEHFMLVLTMETFHVIGLALMFVSVLPELNVVQAAMLTNCVSFVPGLLGLLSRNRTDVKSKSFIFIIVDIAALCAQATAFAVWPLLNSSKPSMWLIPAALVLVSCGWWENYVSIHSPLGLVRSLARAKKEMQSSKHFIYIFVSVWKIVTFLFTTVIILYIQGNPVTHLFTTFRNAFSDHNITITQIQSTVGGGTIPDLNDIRPNGLTAFVIGHSTTTLWILLTQICAAYFAYVVGKFACKILIQGFSYALPVSLTVPVLISLLIVICDLRNKDPCFFHSIIPNFLFYELPPLSILSEFISKEYAWVWLLWFFSQIWITLHIWTPKCERPESVDKLFVSPFYNGLLIDQSMGMNRRRDDQTEDSSEISNEEGFVDDEAVPGDPQVSTVEKNDLITKIYVCATMWHENPKEIAEFLKSIMRLDKHQCTLKNYQEFFEVPHPDFYELETHVFFDNAFEECEHDSSEFELNTYVKEFIKLMSETAFHETRIPLAPPKKYPTPYGGRLVWTLPGNTLMFVHLKDSSKIRHRKRWSQVMYMYYLLGHRIKDASINKHRKKALEENTFILALDGDIDFQPSAVKLLVDLMKMNKNLGAACGRVHPMGSGPMVWYQKFEYAIGHWLQKATEHMIGCVLCSPGCFSLFRAKALMDKNVLRVYASPAVKARHYVQFDQGEDRWLCTLLLKRGYRVEYSAASDSYTHAPEGFNEFYNQRRRWIPSTMANIMDLLMDYKRIVKKNKNISLLYMIYQVLLMVGTILGPGTIFLMLMGAFVAAFSMSIWESFYYNLIPVLIFIIVCFTCESKMQLLIAGVITMIYGLVMMAVIIGIFIQMVEDSLLAPSSIFLFAIFTEILITALMHPQELSCLPCGIIYYVTIPSMYLLLVIYSVANLNDITWGTRDPESKKKSEEEKKETKEAKIKGNEEAKENSFLSFGQNDYGSSECSLTGLVKCVLCTNCKAGKEDQRLISIAKSLQRLEKRLDSSERPPGPQSRGSKDKPDGDAKASTSRDKEIDGGRAFLVNPYWLEDENLRMAEVDFLLPQEEQFWDQLIEKYLFPIIEDKEKQKLVAADLRELRDKYFLSFFMLNAVFVMIIFLMQLNQHLLHVKWPLGVKNNISYHQSSLEVHIMLEHLQLEPIGLMFVAFFGLILVIQFTAMLFHRFSTFTHILASTTLQEWGGCWKLPENRSEKSVPSKEDMGMVEDLHRFSEINSEDDLDDNINPRRKKIMINSGRISTLDDVFRQRIFSMSEGSTLPRNMSTRRSKRAMKSFVARSKSIVAQRNKSQIPSTVELKNIRQVNRNFTGQPGPSTSTQNHDRNNSRSNSSFVNVAFEP